MILNKFGKPSIYLPGCMVVWGVISCCTATTTDFGGLLAVRFFLGFIEAAYFVRASTNPLKSQMLISLAGLPVPFVGLVYTKGIG